METTIEQSSPVEYELKIHATPEDLEPKLKKALREQSKHMDVKGFRQGKVPLGLVKKMHGEAVGYKVAEEYVQEVFDDVLDDRDDLVPLGRPVLAEFDYTLDEDLEATIRFGVRPDVELEDLSDTQVSVLKHEVTDEDVQKEVDALLQEEADLMPLDEGDAIEGSDYVSIDLQRIDAQTDTPIIGDKEEDLDFFLDDDWVFEELRDGLIGRSEGDTFRIELPKGEPVEGDSDDGDETELYEVTVNLAKRPELPEFDAELVEVVTDGQFDDPDELRAEIRRQLEQSWEEQSRNLVRNEVVEKLMEKHPIPVPESVIEMNYDHFRQQIKQQNDGDLPDDFDEEFFRQQYADDAEEQGRWMLIRDEIIDTFDIEATDDDLVDFFEEQAGESGISREQIQQFYNQMPQMIENVKQRIVSDKVFDVLLDEFDVQEKSLDEYREEMQEKEKRRQALAGGPAPGGAPGGAPAGPGA